MLTGFNTNITYKEEIYHVQTEDSGLRNPVITTLLYKGGIILASKKTSYKDLLSEKGILSQGVKEKIKKLMVEQHRAMIEDLFAGKFDSMLKGGKSELTNTNTEESSWEVYEKIETTVESIDDGKTKDLKKESAHREGTFRTLDDILLDHILKRKKA